ncbi:Putative type II secretion system protein [Elusimicrobium minutum Pei191]|uniref:Putative type II secretion system protein n=1 Tax=Elusimicrobium minutum (strain Pei191) TaxID=445932 RepID=B2KCH7_ELUMP|nr:PilT/PilU family type 4a pilus ATPase [Elusimicrobium minutum]ACC98098.1 Putative type II secretion system protein [Elusimicrobium minutum Pei191]
MAVGLTSLLKTVVDNKASGLHLRGNSFSFVRLNRQIKQIEDSFLSNDEVRKIAYACMSDREKKIFEENGTVDFSLDAKENGRFRFNVYRQSGKVCISIRHIPLKIPTFADLNLPGDVLEKITENRRGLVLVTGMTGSGKSSTLAAMLGYINRARRGHILTIEDPIEFVHTEEKCIVSQLALGLDTHSYMAALRASMRQDPDVIMIGELRDSDVVRAAIAAAETGHLVFTTVHTVDAVQTLNRLIQSFPFEQQAQVKVQLAELIKGIVSQRLLPDLKGGMIPAVEVMVDTPQIKKLITDGKIDEVSRHIGMGEYYGMQTFDQSLVELYRAGKAGLEEIIAYSTSPDTIMLALKGIGEDRKGLE